MTGQELIEVVVLVVCFFIAALASGTETALTSVGRLRVRFLAEQGSQAANILQRLRADPNRFLSTVLFVNTLALIVASTATALLSDDAFTRWGVLGGAGGMPPTLSQSTRKDRAPSFLVVLAN